MVAVVAPLEFNNSNLLVISDPDASRIRICPLSVLIISLQVRVNFSGDLSTELFASGYEETISACAEALLERPIE
jgi:hypothetical protein